MRYEHPGTHGLKCAFSPADDLMALGGDRLAFTLHEGTSPPVERFADTDGGEIIRACASAKHVALATATCISVFGRSDGARVWHGAVDKVRALALRPQGLLAYPTTRTIEVVARPPGAPLSRCATRRRNEAQWEVRLRRQLPVAAGGFGRPL